MIEDNYNFFFDSVTILGSSFEDQKKILPDYVDIGDDIISDFENAFLLLPELIENGKFSYNAIAMILRLYNQVQWCLRNISLDDFSSQEWDNVRELAKKVIQIK